jgi:peptide deformylase
MFRPILRYGAAELTTPAREVPAITDEIQALVQDMIDTMYAAKGIGLAAPQIGVDRRVLVVDISAGQRAADLQVLINPVFVAREGMQLEEEGCLSVPGFNATVARPARVVVQGQDLEGSSYTIEGTKLLARALQHEMDHLDGNLFIDRLKGLNREAIVRRIRKLRRSGRW